jgi:hypothetical protein
MENKQVNPTVVPPTGQTMQSPSLKTLDNLPTQKTHNWFFYLLLIITLISLSIAGVFIYKFYSLKKYPVENVPSNTPTPFTSTQKPTSVETQINWLEYRNTKYNYMKFKYPEGASITVSPDPDPTICDFEGCFSITMTYQDLKLNIKHLTGIGGMPSAADYPYSIVAGNYFSGVGKTIDEKKTENTLQISYFKYFDGGQQFGGFLGQAQNFVFTMPIAKKNQYEPIADIIACSVLDFVPEYKGLFSKAYLDYGQNTIVGFNNDQSIYIIFSGNTNISEKVSNITFNSNGKFLTIKTVIGNGPESYLYVYNLETKSIVSIDGQDKYSVIGDPISWLDDVSFISADNNKYYRFYPEQKTRKELSAEEYSNLLKSTSSNQ